MNYYHGFYPNDGMYCNNAGTGDLKEVNRQSNSFIIKDIIVICQIIFPLNRRFIPNVYVEVRIVQAAFCPRASL